MWVLRHSGVPVHPSFSILFFLPAYIPSLSRVSKDVECVKHGWFVSKTCLALVGGANRHGMASVAAAWCLLKWFIDRESPMFLADGLDPRRELAI